MKISVAILLVFGLLFSCKTVQVNQQTQQTTKTVVELGAVGQVNYKLETNRFQITTLPTYKQKLRVAANIVAFNNTTFNTYAQAARQQNQKISIAYIDSVANKPGYANLQILDKTQLINELNAGYNSTVNTYLQNAKNNEIITGVSAYFNSLDLSKLSQADEVYLVNNKLKKYNLELIKDGRKFATVDMGNSVPFAYTTASFCWKKENATISIVNLTTANESCAKDTYRNVSRLYKKTDLFKY